jgi:hypothetical protein
MALSLLVSVAAALAWVRSYDSSLVAQYDFGTRAARVEAERGTLYFAKDVTDSSRYVYPVVGPHGQFAGFAYGTSTLGSWVGVPLWFVLLAAATTFVLSLRSTRRRPPPGHCRACGYDLRATPGRCPECGTIARARPAA